VNSPARDLEIAKLIISDPYEESQVRFGNLLQIPQSHLQSAIFVDDSGEQLELSLRHRGEDWEPLKDGLSVSVNTNIGIGCVLLPALACRCEYGTEPVDGRSLHFEWLFGSDDRTIDRTIVLCPFTGKLWQRLTPRRSPSWWECIGEIDLASPTLTIWRATLRTHHPVIRDYLLGNSAALQTRWWLHLFWRRNPLETVYPRFYVEAASASRDAVEGWLWYLSLPQLPSVGVGMTVKGISFDTEIYIQQEETCTISQWEEMFGWFRSYRIV
jgi:hypothetical protein